MPANNIKIMGDTLLEKIKAKYRVSYDEQTNSILVGLTTCKRITSHSADEGFHINSKKPKRKICFSKDVIALFIECQKEDKTKDITIFDIQNAAISLKVMYQKVTLKSVVDFIRKKFEGIKKI